MIEGTTIGFELTKQALDDLKDKADTDNLINVILTITHVDTGDIVSSKSYELSKYNICS